MFENKMAIFEISLGELGEISKIGKTQIQDIRDSEKTLFELKIKI